MRHRKYVHIRGMKCMQIRTLVILGLRGMHGVQNTALVILGMRGMFWVCFA